MEITLKLVTAHGKVIGLETPDGEYFAKQANGRLTLNPSDLLQEARRQDA